MKRIIAFILFAFGACTVSFAQDTLEGGPEIIRPSGPPLLERSMSTVCDKRELFWARHVINFRLGGLARLVANHALRACAGQLR